MLPKEGLRVARSDGKTTLENAVPEKLKHFNAHVAIDEQSSMPLSQGLYLCGQQSMSSIADMSATSVDLGIPPATPAAGSTATDMAIRSARMVRPMLMALLVERK